MNSLKRIPWIVSVALLWPLAIGAQLQPGGQTIAGPGLFEGNADDFAEVYQASTSRVICITLSAVKGTSRVLTDGTVPALVAPEGAAISACGEASLVTVSCETKCEAEWRIDGEGNVVIENIDIPPAQVTVVGVEGPTGPKGPTGPAGATGPEGPVGPEATPADSVCANNFDRYVDCRNGTATDTVTGLIWLENANCFGLQDWGTAVNSAAELEDGQCGLNDGSKKGDWRLPTKEEWEATVFDADALGCFDPALTDRRGTACYANDPAFSGVQLGVVGYWSSSSIGLNPLKASFVLMLSGFLSEQFKNRDDRFVWPVRGGH